MIQEVQLPDDRDSGMPEDLEPEISQLVANLLKEGNCDIYRIVIHSIERDLLSKVLYHFKGNRVKASRALGISRFTLRKKLRAVSNSNADAPMSESAVSVMADSPGTWG